MIKTGDLLPQATHSKIFFEYHGQKRIYNPVKHLQQSFSAKIVNNFISRNFQYLQYPLYYRITCLLTRSRGYPFFSQKSSIVNVRLGFKHVSSRRNIAKKIFSTSNKCMEYCFIAWVLVENMNIKVILLENRCYA